jgi:LAO/AO transport system kinase
MKPFFVYLLRCFDSSYYCGQTDDIEARLQQHYAGEIGYTSTRKPVHIVWQGEFDTREAAIAFEQQIKGWSRAKKEALIAGDWERIKELAKSNSALPVPSVRPELVEGPEGLRQAQPERSWLVNAILNTNTSNQQRRAIAKAITLLESTRADHRAQADELLTAMLAHTGQSLRLGISGVPGVGKSTFIEVLGLYLIAKGHRVAVLTIDPSSTVSGGSILGDKTRMEKLSVQSQAYIRPSPSSGTLGGVAEKTREAMLVCEAAGYDVVIVETVGVGQSETAVHGMTDLFVLMQLPNAGDDLQAIKKGVMELADLVVINKADIDPDAAMRAQAQITSSLRLLGMHGHASVQPELVEGAQASTGSARTELWHPKVISLSALLGQGVDTFWKAVCEFQTLQTANGLFSQRRQQQALAWMWERIDASLKQSFKAHPAVKEQLPQFTAAVLSGQMAPGAAARKLLFAQSGQCDSASN